MSCKLKIKNYKKAYIDSEEYLEHNRPKDKKMLKIFLERYKNKDKGLKGAVF